MSRDRYNMALANPVSAPFLEKVLKTTTAKKSAARRLATTFIVDDAGDAFYQAARSYYKSYGYPPTVPVKSLEDIIDKLRKRSQIDHIRIVTHGSVEITKQEMELPVFTKGSGRPTAGTEWTASEELLLSDPGVYVAAALDDILQKFSGNFAKLAHLIAKQGSLESNLKSPLKLSDETVKAGKASELLQEKTASLEETYHYDWSPARALVAATAVTALVDAQRGKPGSDASQLEWIADLFNGLKAVALARIPEATRDKINAFLEKLEADAQATASGFSPETRANVLGTLAGSFKGPLEQVQDESRAKEGTFFKKLEEVRNKFSSGAEIEIRGCNIGRDQVFMDRLQAFFTAESGRAPDVSAPNLFQVFSKMAVSTIAPTGSGDLPNLGVRPHRFTRQSQSLLNNEIMVNMSRDTRPFSAIVEDFYPGTMKHDKLKASKMRRQLFPEAKIRAYNPDLDLNSVRPFAKIWLRAPTDDERSALAEGAPLPDADLVLNRRDDSHELQVREPSARRNTPAGDPISGGGKIRALVADWTRKTLLEEPASKTPLAQGIDITYLTAQQGLDKDLAEGTPVIFPGQPQFNRHINVTRGRG